MVIFLSVALVVVFIWGQYWYLLAHRITDIVNRILSEESSEDSEEGVDVDSDPSDRV